MGGEWALGVALVMEVWPNASRALARRAGSARSATSATPICGAIALGLNRHRPATCPAGSRRRGLPDELGRRAHREPATGGCSCSSARSRHCSRCSSACSFRSPRSGRREKEAGAASHWSGRDLLGVLIGAAAALRRHRAVGASRTCRSRSASPGRWSGSSWSIVGYLYPARGYLSRSGLSTRERGGRRSGGCSSPPGLSGVPLLGTWAGLMWMYQWVGKLPGGDIAGRPAVHADRPRRSAPRSAASSAAVLGGVLGRRPVYAALCVLSLVTMVGVLPAEHRVRHRLRPLGRAAGHDLGRVLRLAAALPAGTVPAPPCGRPARGSASTSAGSSPRSGNLQMANLLAAFDNDYAQACAVVAGVYVVGLVLIGIAPETKGKPLPD